MATISDTGRNVSSPWSHLLRSANELEVSTNPTPSSPPSSSSISLDLHPSSEVIQIFDGNSDGATKSKKPVWNVPANGIIEVHPVMGGSWPALSESARASPKSSSDSLKALGDGSVTVPVSSQVWWSSNLGFFFFFLFFMHIWIWIEGWFMFYLS